MEIGKGQLTLENSRSAEMTGRSQVWKSSDQKKGLRDKGATCENSITGPTGTTPGMNERYKEHQKTDVPKR